MHPARPLALSLPADTPTARLLWQAVVDIGERESLGAGPLGERFIVPIVGGEFWGGPGHEALCGRVRPGGADRQLLRPDGVKELEAQYELQLDDGTVLGVHNRVRLDESRQPRYARSQVGLSAPSGPWAWLNRRCFVGALLSLRPQAQAVRVSVFVLD
jgi:hypothetical protein